MASTLIDDSETENFINFDSVQNNMGAELFIEEIHEAQGKKYWPLFDEAVHKRDQFPTTSDKWAREQKKVEKYHALLYSHGYFRDPYLDDNFLQWLGISWDDMFSMLDAESRLQMEDLIELRKWIATAVIHLPKRPKWMETSQWLNLKEKDKSPEWHEYLEERREKLLAFLDEAIRLNSPVLCWL
jgi:hypothetical protein